MLGYDKDKDIWVRNVCWRNVAKVLGEGAMIIVSYTLRVRESVRP